MFANDLIAGRLFGILVDEANRRADGGQATGDSDLRKMLGLLGLENLLTAADGAGVAGVGGVPDDCAAAMLVARDAARGAGDFSEADRLRDALKESGWEVRDGPGGSELVPAP